MTQNIVRASLRGLAAVTLLAAIGLSGCIPVGWLPDSSGFVYTDGKELEQLVLYDVAGGQRRVLVEKLPSYTGWPAVSPDGKQVAVAQITRDPARDNNAPLVRIFTYDLKGTETHRSPDFPWTKANREAEKRLTCVFWAPSGRKLLVHDYEEDGTTGIYDLEKKSLVTVPGLPAPFAGSPIRPDGKVFLVTRKDPGDNAVAVQLVDWDGKMEPIAIKNGVLENDDQRNALQFPWAGTSSWNGNIAEVTFKSARIRIDTGQRTLAIDTLAKAEAEVDGKALAQQYAFPDNGPRVRVLLGNVPGQKDEYHLELLKPGDPRPQLLKSLDAAFILSPAPNQKWLAIRAVNDDLTIWLVNSKGEVKEIAGVR